MKAVIIEKKNTISPSSQFIEVETVKTNSHLHKKVSSHNKVQSASMQLQLNKSINYKKDIMKRHNFINKRDQQNRHDLSISSIGKELSIKYQQNLTLNDDDYQLELEDSLQEKTGHSKRETLSFAYDYSPKRKLFFRNQEQTVQIKMLKIQKDGIKEQYQNNNQIKNNSASHLISEYSLTKLSEKQQKLYQEVGKRLQDLSLFRKMNESISQSHHETNSRLQLLIEQNAYIREVLLNIFQKIHSFQFQLFNQIGAYNLTNLTKNQKDFKLTRRMCQQILDKLQANYQSKINSQIKIKETCLSQIQILQQQLKQKQTVIMLQKQQIQQNTLLIYNLNQQLIQQKNCSQESSKIIQKLKNQIQVKERRIKQIEIVCDQFYQKEQKYKQQIEQMYKQIKAINAQNLLLAQKNQEIQMHQHEEKDVDKSFLKVVIQESNQRQQGLKRQLQQSLEENVQMMAQVKALRKKYGQHVDQLQQEIKKLYKQNQNNQVILNYFKRKVNQKNQWEMKLFTSQESFVQSSIYKSNCKNNYDLQNTLQSSQKFVQTASQLIPQVITIQTIIFD